MPSLRVCVSRVPFFIVFKVLYTTHTFAFKTRQIPHLILRRSSSCSLVGSTTSAGFAASSTSGFVASDRSDSGLRKADDAGCPARRKRESMGGDGEGRKASTLGRARKASNRITRDKRRRAFFLSLLFPHSVVEVLRCADGTNPTNPTFRILTSYHHTITVLRPAAFPFEI